MVPVDGCITTLFPTLHAIKITSKNGVDVFIYMGINIVELNRKGFVAHVKQGDKVVRGQTLLHVDLTYLKKKGYLFEIAIVITNASDFLDVIKMNNDEVDFHDKLITVIF